MTLLRVRLPSPFDPALAASWWRVDATGRIVDRGTSTPSSWPAADRIEAAMSAADVRIVALRLPPMSAARLPSAVAFALEDQLAAPADSLHIAVDPAAARDGVTVAAIADRAAIAWLDARRPPIDRVVAEPALVPRDGAWHWCAGRDGHGFVRRPDGSAFAVGASDGEALPAELAAALARAPREGTRVVVDADADAATLAAWSRATGASFARGTPWSLERVPHDAWAAAPDLRHGYAADRAQAHRPLARAFVPALALAAAAIVLHALATLGTWAHDRYAAWRADRAVVALARDAGLDGATDARAAEALLARRAAAAMHASARMVDGDALPLMARASSALASLPPGALRKLVVAERRLVAEVGALDDARLAKLRHDLAGAGFDAVTAPVAGGMRISATLGP